MKSKNLLALLLCAAMLTCVFAGCSDSSTPTPSPSESASESSAQPSEQPAANESPAGGEAPADVPSEDPAPPPVEVPEVEAAAISYPLTGDDLTLSYWYSSPAYVKWVDSNYNFYCIPYAEEATGVSLKFTEVSETAVSEQFNLMIVAGDWCDLIPVSGYYTGGLSQAYVDEVVFDMTDLVYEYMPDFLKVYESQDEKIKNAALTEDMMLSFVTIADGSMTAGGLVTRGDWLDQIGYEFENDYLTLSDYVDLMTRLQNEFGSDYIYYLGTDGGMSGIAPAFDTSIPSLSASSTNLSVYNNDGTIVTGWTSDGTRTYIEWAASLIDDGLLNRDFIVSIGDQGVVNTACATGIFTSWQANADKIDELINFTDEANAGFQAKAVPPIVADGSTSNNSMWLEESNLVSNGMSISETSKKKELACQWMNYFWTDAGRVLANYGVEGETFEFGAGDLINWSDLVINDPQGGNPEMLSTVYSYGRFVSYYSDHTKLFSTFTPNAVTAIEVWKQEGTSERRYPSFAGLTTEETDSISTKLTDLCSYGQSELLQFMTGTKALDDAAWDNYLATMDSLGLPELLAVYQNAYEEYLAGDRYIASAAAGPGPGGGPPPM